MKVEKLGFFTNSCRTKCDTNIPGRKYIPNISEFDTTSFSSNPFKSNQIMPSTDKLISKVKKMLSSLNDSKKIIVELPNNVRVSFSEHEPNRYLLYVDFMNDTAQKHSNDSVFDLDYRVEKEGKITEFNGNKMIKESDKSSEVRELNQRVRYYLSSLFPAKNVK